MKKRLLLALIVMLTLVVTGTTYAATYADLPKDHWAYDSVTKLAKAGLIDGYGDGTFRGDKTITRYEFAIIIDKVMGKYESADEANKKLIDELSAEFIPELNRMGMRVTKLEAKTNITVSGDTRMRFLSDSPGNSAAKLKGSDKFDFRQRIKFTGNINDNVSIDARIATAGGEKWGNEAFASGSEIGLDLMTVTAKHVLCMDSIRAGRSAFDFFSGGLIGKPMNVDGILINNKFGDVQFKGWTGNVKSNIFTANLTTGALAYSGAESNQFTTGQLGFKLADNLNLRTGYYVADVTGQTGPGSQNIKAGSTYSGSNGVDVSFDYKIGKYTLLGDYISSSLDNAVNMPSSHPKAWAIQFSNSKGPAVMYPAVNLVNPAKPGSDAWMVSYRSVEPGAIPSGTGGFDATAVSKGGLTGITPNATDNLNVLFLAYQNVLAKNVLLSLEYQDFKANNLAASSTSWTSKNVDKTYMMKFEFFY